MGVAFSEEYILQLYSRYEDMKLWLPLQCELVTGMCCIPSFSSDYVINLRSKPLRRKGRLWTVTYFSVSLPSF